MSPDGTPLLTASIISSMRAQALWAARKLLAELPRPLSATCYPRPGCSCSAARKDFFDVSLLRWERVSEIDAGGEFSRGDDRPSELPLVRALVSARLMRAYHGLFLDDGRQDETTLAHAPASVISKHTGDVTESGTLENIAVMATVTLNVDLLICGDRGDFRIDTGCRARIRTN